jgi:ferredoxin
MYKIKINREKCKAGECGGICAKIYPENWRIWNKKAHVVRFKINNLGLNKKVMEACPYQAITIVQI